jgi:hypothetical protein
VSEMRRLKHETRSPFTRALLGSVEADRPESGACDRALGALGLGAASTVTASAAPTAAVVGSSGAKGAGASSILWAKWIGIGLLGSAVAIGSARYVRHSGVRPEIARSDPRTASPSIVAPLLAPIDPPEVAPVATVVAVASSSASGNTAAFPSPTAKTNGHLRPGPLISSTASSNAKSDAAAPATAIAPAPNGSPPVPAADSVTTQLEALSGIRAIEIHAPESALELLDGFERRYPSSPLEEEVAVLRIEALVDAGRGGEARNLANAFLVAHPASAYAGRVRSKVQTP